MKKLFIMGIMSVNLLANQSEEGIVYSELPIEVLEAESLLGLEVHNQFQLGHYIVDRNAYYKYNASEKMTHPNYIPDAVKDINNFTEKFEGIEGPIVATVLGTKGNGDVVVMYNYGDISVKLDMQYDGDFIGFQFGTVECKAGKKRFVFNPSDIASTEYGAKLVNLKILDIESQF